jgi:predicted DsbA family dithiol-disulfide isomerase
MNDTVTTLNVDFVSDVACPWCAVGLASLERALASLKGEVCVNLAFQPFELNPDMQQDGVDAASYLMNKYAMSEAQLAASRANLHARGAEVGFAFGVRSRIWNTFDAHRLMHAAGLEGRALELKRALLKAYHAEGKNPSDPAVLLECASAAGLNERSAREVIETDQYSTAVRDAEAFWQRVGIHGVPAVVIERQHLIEGGQAPHVFAQALRHFAASQRA